MQARVPHHVVFTVAAGAVYWYNTEAKKNYQQTMSDVKASLVAANIPVGSFQLVA